MCEPQRSCSSARSLSVLVAADRDVLRAVVLGEARAAQRDRGRSEREQGDERFLCERLRAGCARSRRAAAVLPTMAAEHRRALEREAAPPGSARRTAGRRAKISAIRAGPRSSRLPISVARSGFSPEATSRPPSSRRMAHAQ